ncbi:class I SAM-dependent methyltransferase [Aceticella autotrophica]|uniref:Class I SAM-dependent methyltransferase n=1 Tax=Aceticella autotrophica TaxID=2755338 RepID=A0A975AUQ5_9THEO|nr:class I SAM-dependent methyltransferase [Aceticella autotrophica]QSZ26781.1 class I SAM-dependent methyltransferase [Aceticella autotrophica]QSZ27085.1 class I SAM-dependent methyltransferase [Aceticella autotrophica]
MEKLISLKPPLYDQSGFLREIASGFEKAQVFFTALELKIFNYLDEFKTARDIAQEIKTHDVLTEKLLDILVAEGLLIKNGEYYKTRPELSPFLNESGPYFARYLAFSLEDRKDWMNLRQYLYEGVKEKSKNRETNHDYDKECIDWIARGAMLGRLQATLKIIKELPEFLKAEKLIDLGCGHGLFGIGLAQENPKLKVILFDRPHVAKVAQEYVNKYYLTDRVKVWAGDYIKDNLGSNYDIAFCSLSFDGNKEESISFFSKINNILNKKGLFILQTFTINNDKTGPISTLLWDLKETIDGHRHMHIFTDSELDDIFKKSGFNKIKDVEMSSSSEMPIKTIIVRKEKI